MIVFNHVNAAIREIETATSAMTESAARGTERRAVSLIRALPKSGRVYARPDAGRDRLGRFARVGSVVHVASAPGQAPAHDTGALERSIHARHEGEDRWVVAVDSPIGVYLERGTRHIAPRPYMRPAYDAAQLHSREQLARFARRLDTGRIEGAAGDLGGEL